MSVFHIFPFLRFCTFEKSLHFSPKIGEFRFCIRADAYVSDTVCVRCPDGITEYRTTVDTAPVKKGDKP